MTRYPLILLVSLAACFGLQSFALKAAGGKTRKSESNYFSSVARLQTEIRNDPQVLFLGSSLTGRLPDRPDVGNLGCDGGSAVITLRAIDEGVLPSSKTIFIEANTLAYELEGRGKEIAAAMRSDWFRVGRRVPNLGATARPAAFVYSWLDARRGGPEGDAEGGGSPFPEGPGFSELSGAPALADVDERKLVEEISGIIDRLVVKGTDVRLVLLPAGDGGTDVDFRIAEAVAAGTKRPWWDMNQGLGEGAIHYTDGRHLDPASAAAVVDAILKRL